MRAPKISSFDRREVAVAQEGRRSVPGQRCQVERAQFGVLVPPRIIDTGFGLQQGVIVPEQTGSPQSVGQSAAVPQMAIFCFVLLCGSFSVSRRINHDAM